MVTRLKRLKVNRFRNVEPCELHFADGHNVLLGLNATGKTTLLNLVAACVGSDFTAFDDEETPVHVAWQVQFGAVEADCTWELEPRARGSHRPAHTKARPSWTVVLKRSGKVLLEGSDRSGFKHALTGVETQVETQQAWLGEALTAAGVPEGATWPACSRYDEATRFLEEVTGGVYTLRTPLAEEVSPNDLRYAGAVPRGNFVMERDSMTADIHLPVTWAGGWLGRCAQALGVPAVDAFLKHRLSVGGLSRFHGMAFTMRDGNNAWTLPAWSYGQKRLLAFFYYAACVDVVVADELVNGLHHTWIDACMKEMGDRQSFLTSQNALLIDHLRLESAEMTRRTFILCEKKDGRVTWRHMDMEVAEEVFAAREVGIQHTSDILKNRGLW